MRIKPSSTTSKPINRKPKGPQPSVNQAQVDSVVLSRSLQPLAHLGALGHLYQPSKSEVADVLKGQSPEQLKLLHRAYKQKTGRELQAQLQDNFRGADLVEVRALANKGGLSEVDSLRSAILDDQGKHVRRILNQKTGSELSALRQAYKKQYRRDLDSDLYKEFEGSEKSRIKQLLVGEPERARGESLEAFQKRQGQHVARLVTATLKEGEKNPFGIIDSKDLLDTLHGRDKEVLEAAKRAFRSTNNRSLKSAIEDSTKGTTEEIALNYLDDGREDSIEKLRRAFSGNNDEELIRRTLRDQSPEARKALIENHGTEIRKLFTQLDDDEKPEMEALLTKGKLDAVDRLKVAVGDGSDKAIVSSLKRLCKADRKKVLTDGALLTKLYDELDDEEHKDVARLLKTGSMSVEGDLRHARTPRDFYAAASKARTPEDKKRVRELAPMLAFKGVDLEQLETRLEQKELTPGQKIEMSNGDDVLTELRTLKPEVLKGLHKDPAILERVRDELSGAEEKEALQLLRKGSLETHEALDLAIQQEDSSRILTLLEGLKSDNQKQALLSEYRQHKRQDLRTALRNELSSSDMRKADNALRLQPKTVSDVERVVRQDVLRDRDDNSIGSSLSNGLTDVFSDAGLNMDDQAREVEHKARQLKRQGGSVEPLLTRERVFQDSREAKAKATKKMADIAVPLLSGLLTAGFGSAALGLGTVGNIIRTSQAARATMVGSSVATRLGLEHGFRGNDFGTARDVKTAVTSAAMDTASVVAGAGLGHRLFAANRMQAQVVRDAVGEAGSYIGDTVARDQQFDPTQFVQRALGGGAAASASFPLSESKSFLTRRVGDGLSAGIVEVSKFNVDMVL